MTAPSGTVVSAAPPDASAAAPAAVAVRGLSAFLWRHPGPRRDGPRRRAGHRPRGRGRERGRQIHAHEDPRRARWRRTRARSWSAGTRSASRPPRTHGARGIGIVYQELSLFPDRSILANLFPDPQPTRLRSRRHPRDARTRPPRAAEHRPGSRPGHARGRARARRAAAGRDLAGCSSSVPGCSSSTNPTRPSTRRESQRLFAVIRDLVRTGITMLYVSHRLEEVFAITDRITVMRNGRLVWTRDRART